MRGAKKIDPLDKLRALARGKWRSCGLTDSHAEQLAFEVLSGEDVAALGGTFKQAGALRIPYFDAKGRRTKFFRIRYLEPLPGFAGQALKPQRYAQPAGTLNEVYAPPLLDRAWQEVLSDRDTTLYITEGEFKAACACALGLATLGLGGVDVWRSGGRGIDMLPMLRDVDWSQRDVVIVFDSDAAENEHVVRAQRVLAEELADRGALPRIASLPAAADGAKQGLDDFLVAQGPEALAQLVEDEPVWSEAAALWRLNEEVAYVRNPGMVIVRRTGRTVSPDAFVSHAYANRKFLRRVEGRPPKEMSAAREWVQCRCRYEVEKLTYRPGLPDVVNEEVAPGYRDRCLNVRRGWGVEPRPGSVELWDKLLTHLFTGAEPWARGWFERWCAYPLQRPGTKLFTAAVVWGVNQGTGKTFVGELLRRIYGDGTNATLVEQETLSRSFNGALANRQFVQGDEITGAGENRQHADKLKGLISSETIRINEKYVPEYELPTCANYYFTSNHPDAFFLEDADRRFFIHNVKVTGLPSTFYQALREWKIGDGPAALFHHLLRLDLGDFDPRAPAPSTDAKREMLRDAKSDVGLWVHELRESGTALSLKKDCDLFTPAELLRAYDVAGSTKVKVNGLGRELKKAGFPWRKFRVGDDTPRFYAVRNRDRWAVASEREWSDHRKQHGPKPVASKLGGG
jgi:hypothetical protein